MLPTLFRGRLARITALVFTFVTVIFIGNVAGSASALQRGKIADPNVAAKRLYNAWKTHNRHGALAFSSKEAVDKLFSVRYRVLKSSACEHVDEGFQCVFHDPKGLFDMSIIVDGGASAGYSVTSVSFSSEG